MSVRNDAVSVLLGLPAATLSELGRALSSGSLSHGFSRQSLQPFVGNLAPDIERALNSLRTPDFGLSAAGLLCESLARALAERDAAERRIQLVLSGPEVAGVPVVDTRTTVLSLFEEATAEVLISSYVFHEAAEFFRTLAGKHDALPDFRVCFFVDISHRRIFQTQPVSLVTQAFAAEFSKKHWPGQRMPELWHDPRAFASGAAGSGVLHAKVVIVDQKVAFITSANFTGAAQTRNIEAGVLIRQPRIAASLHSYFLGLIASRHMCQIQW